MDRNICYNNGPPPHCCHAMLGEGVYQAVPSNAFIHHSTTYFGLCNKMSHNCYIVTTGMIIM
jgi:hypothetical protein